MEETNGFYVGRPKNWRDYYEIAEQQCAELIADPENPHALDTIMEIYGKQFVG